VRTSLASRAAPSPARTDGTNLSRAFWLLVAGGVVAILVTAAWLRPDPTGFGTHTQLGLGPCRFYLATGLPCPACGLTTSFAYLVRLDVWDAAKANPFGPFLFAALLAALAVAINGFLRKYAVMIYLERLRADLVLMALVGVCLTVWVVRMAGLI
jgi:hypothetical protein